MLQCERLAASLAAGACCAKDCCNAPCAGSMTPLAWPTAVPAARCCSVRPDYVPSGSYYTLLTPNILNQVQ